MCPHRLDVAALPWVLRPERSTMEIIEVYRGFQILNAGELGLVVFDPASTKDERYEAVLELAAADSLDALWLGSLADARASVDSFVELREGRGRSGRK